ncbi:MAG: cupin domain-containing protein [Verrucomicrobiae bacterium]|nr:cupin domain-containing protein [Verrucomicrobiae bacterium]
MNPTPSAPRRFVTLADALKEEFKGRTNYWICRPEVVEAERLQICQATLPPGKGHNFHTHPELEEVIYVLSGHVEQWVETSSRRLGPGDSAHIPAGVVHATFNRSGDDAVILAILSPAAAKGPFLVDVSDQEPWRSLDRSTPNPA